MRDFLDLSMEIKQTNRNVIAGSGYVAPSKGNPLYEGLGLYDIVFIEAVSEFCNQLQVSFRQRKSNSGLCIMAKGVFFLFWKCIFLFYFCCREDCL